MNAGPSKLFGFLDQHHAATVLPIDLKGREVLLDAYAYQGDRENEQVLVLVHRDLDSELENAIPLVRVHSGCVTGDIFHSLRCDCYLQLHVALDAICSAPLGALVYLPYHEGRGIGLFKKLRADALQDQGVDAVDANTAIGAPVDARDYTLTARSLLDLGMSKIRLMSNNPAMQQALSDFGITIAGRAPLNIETNPVSRRYHETKRSPTAHDF